MAGKSSKHAKLRIKKGDEVIVITGKDKGKKGSVLRVVPADRRILVQGVNMVKRHTRPTSAGPGGIIEQEAMLDVSNVAHIDPKPEKPTRVSYPVAENGRQGRDRRPPGEGHAGRAGNLVNPPVGGNRCLANRLKCRSAKRSGELIDV